MLRWIYAGNEVGRHGGQEVLSPTEVEAPQPGRDEVLVRLKATAVNSVDTKTGALSRTPCRLGRTDAAPQWQ